MTAIQSAVDNLAAHPLVGHRVEGELRELIISYGQTGYVAFYRFVVSRKEVRILPSVIKGNWDSCRSKSYASRFRNSVMISAFVKSMKNAPTIGATRNARGAGP